MKRLTLLTIGLILIVTLQFVLNCARPLESTDDYDNPQPNPPIILVDTVFLVDTLIFGTDTIFVVDTVIVGADTTYLVDTVINTDTLVITDTLEITDTLVIVDTVIVVVHDSTDAPTFCGRIGWFQKKLVWMLQNESGHYRLEFAAQTERDRPEQELTVIIDGEEYPWHPAQTMALELELDLAEDAVIKIRSEAPCAFGHAIDICLKVTEL